MTKLPKKLSAYSLGQIKDKKTTFQQDNIRFENDSKFIIYLSSSIMKLSAYLILFDNLLKSQQKSTRY